jgi:hypothetical protein
MLHGIVCEAAGLRPGIVHDRSWQGDLDAAGVLVGLDVPAVGEYGDPFAGQRRLLLVEDIATGQRQRQEERGQQHTRGSSHDAICPRPDRNT